MPLTKQQQSVYRRTVRTAIFNVCKPGHLIDERFLIQYIEDSLSPKRMKLGVVMEELDILVDVGLIYYSEHHGAYLRDNMEVQV